MHLLTTRYSKSLMFSVCLIAEQSVAPMNGSSLVRPTVNILLTASDTPTPWGSSGLPSVYTRHVLTWHHAYWLYMHIPWEDPHDPDDTRQHLAKLPLAYLIFLLSWWPWQPNPKHVTEVRNCNYDKMSVTTYGTVVYDGYHLDLFYN